MITYRLMERIDGGRGGFADVYRAVSSDTGREVAVKMLRDYQDLDARRRFQREVRILRSLRHSGIVSILDYNLELPQPFYVMPLMTGGCLTRWAGRLEPRVLRVLLLKLSSVLALLHSRGTLHRDVKPDNIFVDEKGNCAVGDFGLGNDPRCTMTFTLSNVGTPGYAAPELAEGWGAASAASDIYSLGATVFHLQTGVHPTKAGHLESWVLRRAVPPDLRRMVAWMMQRDPSKRPTATQVILSLKEVANDSVRLPVPPPLSGLEKFLGAAAIAILGVGLLTALVDE